MKFYHYIKPLLIAPLGAAGLAILLFAAVSITRPKFQFQGFFEASAGLIAMIYAIYIPSLLLIVPILLLMHRLWGVSKVNITAGGTAYGLLIGGALASNGKIAWLAVGPLLGSAAGLLFWLVLQRDLQKKEPNQSFKGTPDGAP